MTAMTSDLMDGLVQWLRAQLAEYERIARAATPGPWEQDSKRVGFLASAEYWDVVDCSGTPTARGNAEHVARHDPARVLREIDAKRQALDHYEWVRDRTIAASVEAYVLAKGVTAKQIQFMGLAYADRPGYREEWRP